MKGLYNESSNGYDPIELARSYFTMSNDSFYRIYGFNWIPSEPLYSIIKKELEKEVEEKNKAFNEIFNKRIK